MVLISIVIALVLEKLVDLGRLLRRFGWFSAYLAVGRPLFAPCLKVTPMLAVVVAAILPILVFGLIYLLLHNWIFGLIGLLLNIAILIYCIGPVTLHSQWQAYVAAKQANDSAAIASAADALFSELPETNSEETTKPIVGDLVLQAYLRIFAVLFWFTVLGWVGALGYRLIAQCRVASDEDNELSGFARAAACLQRILDWIPARVFALMLMVVGAFSPAFGVWIRHVIKGLDSSYALIVSTAMAALSPPATAKDDILVGKEAALLIERSLIVWIVIVALLTIGRFIG